MSLAIMKSDFSSFPLIEFDCHGSDLKNVIIPKPKPKIVQASKIKSVVDQTGVPMSINILNNMTLGKRDVSDMIGKILEKSVDSFTSNELKKTKLE